MPARGFGYDGLEVEVASADQGPLAWLAEFLSPAFLSSEGGEGCRVELVEDDERYRAALAAGPAPDDEGRDAFAHDQAVIRLPRWRSAGTALALFDRPYRVLYEAGVDRRAYTVLTPAGNRVARIPLMRVVRELAMNHAMRGGGVILHASALAVDGRVLLLAGPKGAGKTTLLIHALGTAAACYVSNDRVRVRLEGGRPTARAMPSIVTLRPQTRALFPELECRLAASSYDHQLSRRESVTLGGRPPRPWPDGRLGLSPAQFCDLLGVAPAAEGEIIGLVFPSLTGERGGLALRPLDGAAAAARAAEALFAAPSRRKDSEVFVALDDLSRPGEAPLAERCRDLARRVPCFECELGLDAYESVGSLERLLELLA